MVIPLTSTISRQISQKAVNMTFTFTINGVDYSSSLLSNWGISTDRKFGAASATFTLNNNTGAFGNGGANEIKVGDTISFTEQFTGDSTSFTKFYGLVKKRSIAKGSGRRTITLVCLDYISRLQDMDINLDVEGTRVEVVNETLTPVYLSAPNDNMAQLYNFANNGLATLPPPSIKFKDTNHTTNVDTQYDGYEVYYDVGQLKLGSPLNAKDNYTVLSTYFYYVKGVFVEDVIEAILTEPDGYGNYLFGESTAADVISNHLTENLSNITSSPIDAMTTNLVSETITIDTTLASAVTEGVTSVVLTSSSGFPTSGEGSINGDTFTWSGKSSNTLTGVPATGSYALKAHNSGDYAEYEASYAAGKVWYLSYDNVLTTLDTGNFENLGGETVAYFDKRYGRILLTGAISTASNVRCLTNYSFKTLQASGIQLNRITFRKREIKTRFDAIKKVREYVAPNYVIITKGDAKIWTSYLTQKTSEDYTLELASTINYLEDEDLYTRVVLYGKNENPTNIMFGDEVDYESDTEDDYTGIASFEELYYFGEEKSGILSTWAQNSLSEAQLLHQSENEQLINHIAALQITKTYPSEPSGGSYVFSTPISGRGGIILGDIIPTVYINDVPINNTIAQQVAIPVKITSTVNTITEGGGKSKSVSTTTYYYYKVVFAHTSIVPGEPIYIYDNQGLLRHTLSPNDPNMNYATGIWTIPGIEQNDVAEVLSTASYKVLYSTDKLNIDYEEVIFKIDKSIIPNPDEVIVRATFEYWAIAIAIRNISTIVDGRRDTQLQVEFFGEPPAGFHLATIDLGTSYVIQALDIVGGFYKPDDLRKFDVNFKVSMQYSTDGTNFYAIGDKTESFDIGGGEVVQFDEEALGSGFTARYLKFNLDDVDRIPYGKGRYVIAITEISAYSDIIIESEATLIPTTTLSESITGVEVNINVGDTDAFDEPESGETTKTAYIGGTYSFTYTGLTSTAFLGCTIESGGSGTSGDRVSQTVVGDTTLYDDDGLLAHLGDRLYKSQKISDRNLYSQSELDTLSKKFLKEFYKNHSKLSIGVIYAPYLEVGQTVKLVDSYNNTDTRYFIEGIKNNKGLYSLTLARYPA